MAHPSHFAQPARAKAADRVARLARALRDNLRRRKEQARAQEDKRKAEAGGGEPAA